MKDLLRNLQDDLREFTQDVTVHIDWRPDAAPPAGRGTGAPEAGEATPAGPLATPGASTAIELHPGARGSFDTRAESLLSMLTAAPVGSQSPSGEAKSSSQEQIVIPLPAHATPAETTLLRDREGNPAARAFIHGLAIIGLKGEGYRSLRKLAEDVQRNRALRELVGAEALEELIFGWIHARVTGMTAQPMSEFVLRQVAERVAEFEVVLPLFRVELAEPLQIGRVTLRTITAADFGLWESGLARAQPEVAAGFRQLMLRERKRMQGFAAATVSLRGEREHVLGVALEEAEQAVAMLRLFSPEILSPRARSFCALWGRESIEAPTYLVFDAARTALNIGTYFDTAQDYVSRFDAERVRLIREQALDGLVASLFDAPVTEFRDEIRSVIIL